MTRETCLTIDHELGKVWLDTTEKKYVTIAMKMGFVETTSKSSVMYRRFEGAEENIRIRGKSKRTGNAAILHPKRPSNRDILS